MGKNFENVDVLINNINEMKVYIDKRLSDQTNEIIKNIEKVQLGSDEIIVLRGKINELENQKSQLEYTLQEAKKYISQYEMRCQELENICKEKEDLIYVANDKIDKMEIELVEKNQLIVELKSEKEDIVSLCEEKVNSINDKLILYEALFKETKNAFLIYQNLSDEIKVRIKNIFGYNDIRHFIASTLEWNNIEGLWNFAKRRIIEEQNEESKQLVYLFRYLFEQYCKGNDSNAYELITPIVGDKYDSDMHSIFGTRTDGIVSEVLIDGIYNLDTKSVLFKAVIKVQ